MRRLLLLTVLCIMTLSGAAQRRCIVMFDCTGSMKQNNCWELAQHTLKDLVENTCDDKTEIVIVPYQDMDHPLTIVKGNKQMFRDASAFNCIFENIEKSHKGTCMINALEVASRYIDPSYYNIICLITDGKEEDCSKRIVHTQNDLLKVLQEWCAKYGNSVQNFYIPLSKAAMDPAFLDILDLTCFSKVDPTKKFGNFAETNISINTEEISLNKLKIINFTRTDRNKVKIANEDRFFDVQINEGYVNHGFAHLAIKPKDGLTVDEIRNRLGNQVSNDIYTFTIKFESDEVDFGKDCYLDINIVFKLEKILSFPDDISLIDFKEANYYPSFWFFDAKELDTLSYTIIPTFNDESIRKNAYARFRLVSDNEEKVEYKLFVNGDLKENNEFVLSATSADTCKLKLLFTANNTDGIKNFHLELVPASSNIDKITGHTQFNEPNSYRIPVKAGFDIDCNPWKIGIYCILGLIILFLLLKLIAYRLRVTKMPKFKGGKIWIFENNQRLTNDIRNKAERELLLTSANKCIITNKIPKVDNVLRRWFISGNTIYFYNESIPYDQIILYPDSGAVINGSYHNDSGLQVFSLSHAEDQRKKTIELITIEYKH